MTESPNLADTLTEPTDGTRFMARDEDGHLWAIWRDDAKADEDDIRRPNEHWFESATSFPLSWSAVMEKATEAYAIAEKPMTAETPEIARTCRHCGKGLNELKGRFYSRTPPVFFCTDDRRQLHEPAEPTTTPECVAVDKILRWDEVQEGDLALIDGMRSVVTGIRPPHEGKGWQSFDFSAGGTRSINDDDLTAVTRYETTES